MPHTIIILILITGRVAISILDVVVGSIVIIIIIIISIIIAIIIAVVVVAIAIATPLSPRRERGARATPYSGH